MGQAKSKADRGVDKANRTRDTSTFDMLPRFPQPFLERLAGFASWEDVLSLVSTCKREAPMREYWINEQSAAVMSEIGDHLNKFVARFLVAKSGAGFPVPSPSLSRKSQTCSFAEFARANLASNRRASWRNTFSGSTQANIGISTRYPCKSFSFKS